MKYDFTKYRHLIRGDKEEILPMPKWLDKQKTVVNAKDKSVEIVHNVITPEEDGATIYAMPFAIGGLGDYWACTNYFLGLSEKLGEIVNLNCSHYAQSMVGLCSQFVKSSGTITFTNRTIQQKPDWMEAFKYMLPTKILWEPGPKTIISYQFDGVHEADVKNPQPDQIDFFIKKIKSFEGYKPVNIGGRRWLGDCIKIMARSKCLVASPSGMSVIARSVNVPTCILYNNLPAKRIKQLQQIQLKSENIWWFKNATEMFASWDQLPFNH